MWQYHSVWMSDGKRLETTRPGNEGFISGVARSEYRRFGPKNSRGHVLHGMPVCMASTFVG